MNAMNKQQSGFTLIELIMVIVILGILSAFALPRFADLGSDAREASLSGLAGALKSASAISHSAWLAGGSTGNVVLEGVTITMTADGYPDALAVGITAAAQVDSSYVPSADNAGADITYTIQAGCSVEYDVAGGAPVITVDDSSC